MFMVKSVVGNYFFEGKNCIILISGTTEKIFELKKEVYDAFVDNQNLVLSESLSSFGKINSADKKRYQQLRSYR